MRLRRRTTAPAVGTDAASRIAAVAEHGGASVDEVLREVADFRLALETDMLIAAAAADAGEAQIASDVLAGERVELASFQERMLDRLADAAADDEISGRRAARAKAERRIRVRHMRLAGAAAAVLGLIGGGFASRVAEVSPATEQVALAEAEEQLDVLARATLSGSTASVEAMAAELHETLEELIAEHAGGDPAVAAQIARILHEEQALLDQRPSTDSKVIARVITLAKRLSRLAPKSVRGTIAPLIPETESRPKARDDRSTASPKPSPSPSATSKSPAASPSASPSRSASSSSSPDEGDNAGPFSSVAP
jgi:hypothetical protein